MDSPKTAEAGAKAPRTLIQWIDAAIQKGEEWAIFGLVSVLILGTFLQVVLRNLPGNPSFPWIDMLARLVVLWVGLLGASLAIPRDKHINVDVLSRYLPQAGKKAAWGIAGVTSMLILAALTHGTLEFATVTSETSNVPIVEFESLGISISDTIFAAVLPILFIFMLWHTWVALIDRVGESRPGRLSAQMVGVVFALLMAGILIHDLGIASMGPLGTALDETFGAILKANPIIFLFVLIVLAMVGAPLYVVLAGVALVGHYALENMPVANFITDGYNGFRKSPIFLAIPLFTLAGFLMAEGKTADRLVGLFRGFLGWLPGGVAIVGLLACSFFTAFTGASGVTIIALGGLLLPILLKDRYPESFSLGLMTTGGSRGLIFPPSIPVFLIAMIMGLSWDGVTGTGGFGDAVKPITEQVDACYASVDEAKRSLVDKTAEQAQNASFDNEVDRKLEERLRKEMEKKSGQPASTPPQNQKVETGGSPDAGSEAKTQEGRDEFELGDDEAFEGDDAAGDKKPEPAATSGDVSPKEEEKPGAARDEFELGDDDTIEVKADAPRVEDKAASNEGAEPEGSPQASAEDRVAKAPEAEAGPRDEFELGDDETIGAKDKDDSSVKSAEVDGESQKATTGSDSESNDAAKAADTEPGAASGSQGAAETATGQKPQGDDQGQGDGAQAELAEIPSDSAEITVPSSSQIFTAGVIPGLLMVIAVAIYAIWVGVRRKVYSEPFTLRSAARGLVGARYELPIPILIGVGIFGGFFTPSEAASATAVYVMIMQLGLYRDFGFAAFRKSLVDSVVLVGGILIIVLAAMGMLNYLVTAKIPDLILATIENMMPEELPVFNLFSIPRQITFLLLLNVFLLIVGCLMDIFSATLVVLPLILPLAYKFGIHPAHLAVIFITNLEIGYSTPPVGINLFVASLRFNKPVVKLYSASLAFLAIMLVGLLLITYWPGLSLWLVEVTGVQ